MSFVYYYSENRATSRVLKVLPSRVFPRFGGKNGGVLNMRMQVILDSLFACSGSAPIWGGEKGEFRDWTTYIHVTHALLAHIFPRFASATRNCFWVLIGSMNCLHPLWLVRLIMWFWLYDTFEIENFSMLQKFWLTPDLYWLLLLERTPLHWAVTNPDPGVVRLILVNQFEFLFMHTVLYYNNSKLSWDALNFDCSLNHDEVGWKSHCNRKLREWTAL